MRRSDREVKDPKELLGILDRCGTLRLAMVDQGRPYVVPLNFGYRMEDGQLLLYLHSAQEGRKMAALTACPEVCFEADRSLRVTGEKLPCTWTTDYESVIGFGTVEFVEECAEKILGLNALMEHYGFRGRLEYDGPLLERTAVYRIRVRELTGKRHITE